MVHMHMHIRVHMHRWVLGHPVCIFQTVLLHIVGGESAILSLSLPPSLSSFSLSFSRSFSLSSLSQSFSFPRFLSLSSDGSDGMCMYCM